MDTPLLVLTTAPDAETAHRLATLAVKARLAACANILGPATALYHWEGRIEENHEVPLLLKTRTQCYTALEALLRAEHPYTVPEIIALPITQGLPDYLAWIAAETRPPAAPPLSSSSCTNG